MIALVALSIIVAIVSYHFVEQPFRGKSKPSSKKVILLGLATILVFSCIGLFIHKSKPVSSSDLPPYLNEFRDMKDRNWVPSECKSDTEGNGCDLGDKDLEHYSFVVWGDSHAEMLHPVFDQLARDSGVKGRLFNHPTCLPVLGIETKPLRESCQNQKSAASTFILDNNISTVIMISRWDMHILWENSNGGTLMATDETGEKSTQKSIELLSKNIVKMLTTFDEATTLYFFKQIPLQKNYDYYTVFYKSLHENKLPYIQPVSREEHLEHTNHISQVLQNIDRTERFKIIDPTDVFCGLELCAVKQGEHLLYSDYSHLTPRGGEMLRDLFISNIDLFKSAVEAES